MSDNPTPWAIVYRREIERAATAHNLNPLTLLAVAWQESGGGVLIEAGSWTWHPRRLYRYEPAFWDRYMAGKREWMPPGNEGTAPRDQVVYPHPSAMEAWKRRVSSSYGICQVMYATAVQHGFAMNPEALLDPKESAWYGARHLRSLLDGPAKQDLRDAFAGYNTGRCRDETTPYDDEVIAKLKAITDYKATGKDPFS